MSYLDDLINWLYESWQAVVTWIYDLLLWLVNAFLWVTLKLFELVLQGFRTVFNAVEPPDFLVNGLSSVSSSISPDIGYMLGATGVNEALGIIGLAYAFRMARKVLTLFQW